jgi:nitrite reductase/ring-hydroxylating ferredoxin subunit
MPDQILARLEDLKRVKTLKFLFREEGIQRQGFLSYFQGRVLAYENVCRHIPITLDYGDGEFFTRDGKHIICQTHGATYEPSTGLCIAGPCVGASLRKLTVKVENGMVALKEFSDESDGT